MKVATASGKGGTVLGRIPYHASMTRAQIQGQSMVACNDGAAATAIQNLWEKICQTMR